MTRGVDQSVFSPFFHLEQQFIVHLQQHRGGQALDRVGHADHRAADHVCGCPLDRRVNSGPLGEPGAGAFGADLWRVDFASEQGLHKAMLFRERFGVVHIGADAGETFEITVNEALCLGSRNAQVARQAKARDAIDDTKVDRLGLTAHVRCHFIEGDAEHF